MKINVINITRDGKENDPVLMELEHFLKAKKVQPDRWKPADKEAEKLIAKIPMDAVPVGTTMDDVAKFEANRGKNTAKGKSRFEMLLKAAESGTDIQDVDEDVLDQSQNLKELISEKAPSDYKSPVVETKPGEIDPNKVVENLNKEKTVEKKSKYNEEDLMKLTMDKLQAIADKDIPDGKQKDLVMKAKKKADLVKSIIQLTKK